MLGRMKGHISKKTHQLMPTAVARDSLGIPKPSEL